jgi:AmmeMemoRadiSam system protein B
MINRGKLKVSKKAILALSLSGIALVCFVLVKKSVVHPTSPTVAATNISIDQQNAIINHKLIFYEQRLFFEGVTETNKNDVVIPKNVAGGIIPHHLLPSALLSGFFKELKQQNPERIILLGPNHNELGYYNSISSLYGWETPFGVVQPDQQTINDLASKDLVHINENVTENEHSVAGIMPYIKFYLPDARVVPIITRGIMKQAEAQKLAGQLAQYKDDQTVIIAAADFSHYLDAYQAQEKDQATYDAMQRFDYRKILSFNNDYTCSPTAITVLLMAMQDLGKTKFNLLQHTNSGFLENNLYMKTTSYFTIMFN